MTAGYFFYDAPTDSGGAFDDFVAIEHEGNVSTMSFPDYFININEYNSGGFGSTRSVTRYHVTGIVDCGLTRCLTLSNFLQGAPVVQYSPAVFDAFVNNTRVSSRAYPPSLLHVDPSDIMGVRSSGGKASMILTLSQK